MTNVTLTSLADLPTNLLVLQLPTNRTQLERNPTQPTATRGDGASVDATAVCVSNRHTAGGAGAWATESPRGRWPGGGAEPEETSLSLPLHDGVSGRPVACARAVSSAFWGGGRGVGVRSAGSGEVGIAARRAVDATRDCRAGTQRSLRALWLCSALVSGSSSLPAGA